MDTFPSRKAAWRTAAIVATVSMALISHAGTFSFTPGSWSNLAGTVVTNTGLYEATSDSKGLSGVLTLKPRSTGTNSLSGTWSFTVVWKPANGEPAPVSVKVTLACKATFIVSGSSSSKICKPDPSPTAPPGSMVDLFKVDSTNNYLSNIDWNLPNKVVTLPMVLQADGSYKASGSVDSDTVQTTSTVLSKAVLKGTERISLLNLELN